MTEDEGNEASEEVVDRAEVEGAFEVPARTVDGCVGGVGKSPPPPDPPGAPGGGGADGLEGPGCVFPGA